MPLPHCPDASDDGLNDILTYFHTLQSAMQSYLSKDPHKRAQALVDENARLKRQVQRLETANDECARLSVRHKESLQEAKTRSEKLDFDLKQSRVERADAKAQLEKARQKLEEGAREMTKVQNEMKLRETRIADLKQALESETQRVKVAEAAQQKTNKELREARQQLQMKDKDLQKKNTELEKLDKLATKLVPMSKQNVCRRLDDIFVSAYELCKSYFAEDFEESISGALAQAVKELEQHNLVKNCIPVPASNTAVAKQMRTAAALAVIAAALTEIIFQPTYLLGKESELFKSMPTMASNDPSREAFLREVFLAVTLSQPQKQKDELSRMLTAQVVKHVFRYVKKLIPTSKQAAFESSLEDICRQALECWRDVQRWQERVSVTFYHYDTEWKLLVLPSPEANEHVKGQANGHANGYANGQVNGQANGHVGGQNGFKSVNFWLDPVDIGAVVWPGFSLLRSDGQTQDDILTEGYALNLEQIRGAKDEGTRRAARQNSRRTSSLKSPTYPNATDVDSAKSFLSSGDGGGSKENFVVAS